MEYHRDIQAHQQRLTSLRREIQLINEKIRHAHDEYHREALELRRKSEYEIKELERQLDRKEKDEANEEKELKSTEDRLKKEMQK